MYERTAWGWLGWTVPRDGTVPEVPHQIAVLTPAATWWQRLGLRWLLRRRSRPIRLAPTAALVPRTTAAMALVSLPAGLVALAHGLPADVTLPAMPLLPLLAEHLPERLDGRAREHVLTIEGEAGCRRLLRLATLQTGLVQAAARSISYEVHRSAEIGHHVLWDAALQLQTQDNRSVPAALEARERLMLQLTAQAAQAVQRSGTEDGPASDGADLSTRALSHQGARPKRHR
ncbi:hypothetical protein ABZZ74_51725 [Streptomyces sp. NPDC006476]|uniref:hypothetical protein n=1 Tax=Streptomyces sp. NPDC006476 TaxID=3157175 RepID=UPI0033AD5AED